MKLKEIRNLIDHSIWVGGRTTRVVNAILEADAIETTFAEIAKLQQRILGDSKTIGGTAHNSDIVKCLCEYRKIIMPGTGVKWIRRQTTACVIDHGIAGV